LSLDSVHGEKLILSLAYYFLCEARHTFIRSTIDPNIMTNSDNEAGLTSVSKHETRSAQTRDLFICAAQQLYADRSIDSVSLSEITVAAKQKNRNALQYHFGNQEGLLQAILDRHSSVMHQLRQQTTVDIMHLSYSPAEASARILIMPIGDYIEANSEAVAYVKILSQLAALNSQLVNPNSPQQLSFQDESELKKIMALAFSHLPSVEAQRRLFLVVSFTFHAIADISRAKERSNTATVLKNHDAMFDQLVSAVAALIAAPSVSGRAQ
jgi:AcrR family transcriptional regulator